MEQAAKLSREEIVRVTVMANQLGYLPGGTKTCVVESQSLPLQPKFWVIDANHFGEDACVFEGQLTKVDGDFGAYWIGDFSKLTSPGLYVIRILPEIVYGPENIYHSQTFFIGEDIYSPLIEKGLECFALQRCGPSTTGYHAPCHLDDGIRADNGEFMDVVGGWHDANDLLKWSSATLSGMIGLLGIAEHTRQPEKLARLYEELQWGNRYFLKLQDPQGYYYSHGIGGDPPEQGNHFTDNRRGTPDDRRIVVQPAAPYLQHLFITAQADLARNYRDWDAQYSKTCLDAAVRCYQWVKNQPASTYQDYGTGAAAGWSLYIACEDPQYLEYARQMAFEFARLQNQSGSGDTLQGYFFLDESRSVGAKHSAYETLGLVGFCRFVEESATLGLVDTGPYRQCVQRYVNDYLLPMTERNAFGIVPYQVHLDEALSPGARIYQGCTYRYFMSYRNGRWWVGNNGNLAGTGIALCSAARILSDDRFRRAAQRLLDWILGVNPFAVSQVNGIGHQNAPEYIYTGFQPRTPKITGAVVCGICGDGQDRPDLQAGSYHSAEIWTPMTVQTMWLGWELSR